MDKSKLSCVINFITLLFLFLPLSLQAGEEKIGTSSASFLKIGVGARAAAMGQAYCALSDDLFAIYYNPAGLANLKDRQLSYAHNLWFDEITHGFLAFAHPIKDIVLGLGIDYLTMGKAKETTEQNPGGTGREFRIEDDLALFLSISKRIREDLSSGMNIKYIKQGVADETASGFGLDLGLLWQSAPLNLGLTIQNLGEKESNLPFNIKAGLAYKEIENTTFVLDVHLPRDNKISYHLGGEYWIRNILALRAGYNSHLLENSLNNFGLKWLTLGFGVNLKVVQLDAAYLSYGDLGNTYRFSLLSRF
ncbi:PorV/PorQ family protein [bacterium]|nr:PorV/PorQ family protein [bacterium]